MNHVGSSLVIDLNNNINIQLSCEPEVIESVISDREITLSEVNSIPQEAMLVENTRVSDNINRWTNYFREAESRQRLMCDEGLVMISPEDIVDMNLVINS